MKNMSLIAIAGLTAFVTYCFNRGQGVRTVKREVKQDLHRWEDEGGNVPAVATPSPVTASAAPGVEAEMRH
jgi:hypothetical protein